MVEAAGSNSLEQDIARIERELASKRETLQQQKESGEIRELPHDKETLHEVIREKIETTPPSQTSTATDTDTDTDATQAQTVPPPAVPQELHQKVQALVNVAFLKSIDEAVKEAKATNNAALIDAFHDLLVDELYNHLIERGKLKKM